MLQLKNQDGNWCTQKQLADKLNISIQRVHNWVRRGKVDTKELPPTNTLLVNKLTIKIKKYSNFV